MSYIVFAGRGGLAWRFPQKRLAWCAAALTFPLPLDGWANALQLWSSPAGLRALTGLAAGVAIPVLLLPLAASRRARLAPDTLALLGPLCAGLGLIAVLTHLAGRIELDLLALACVLGFAGLLVNLGLALREAPRG